MDSDKCLFPTKQQYMSNPLDSPCKSAYSETTGNCQDSESSSPSSSSDQSGNINNASGLGMQAMKKRRQAVHSHKLSYKRRRDKINKRIGALRNLIPNCSKSDKESVLDEAIEYLKSLQLQLQIMPTFAGFCVPPTPIMFPTLGNAINLRLRADGLQLFGLPLAGYGTKLQMPMNALPAQQSSQKMQSWTFLS